MEKISLSNTHRYYQQLLRFGRFNTYFKRKTFVQKPREKRQRLIPLTKEIVKAMTDFNASESSISEKPFYNSISITSQNRNEVQNILQLSTSDQFIRKEDNDDIIQKYLQDDTVTQDCEAKTNQSGINQEFEMTVEEILEDKDGNVIIAENLQILEQRIETLEERFNYMLEIIPKLRHIQDKRKFNTKALTEELVNMMQRMDKLQEQVQVVNTSKNDKEKQLTIYDDIYYTNREYTLNLLNYKKSIETIKLNQKPKLNPYIKPVNMILLPSQKKSNQHPMFLSTNNI